MEYQKSRRNPLYYLTIGGPIFFYGPTSFSTEGFQDLVVVAVLGELVISLRPQTSVDLGCNSPSSPLSPLVVFPLLPGRQSTRPTSSRRHSNLSRSLSPLSSYLGAGFGEKTVIFYLGFVPSSSRRSETDDWKDTDLLYGFSFSFL